MKTKLHLAWFAAALAVFVMGATVFVWRRSGFDLFDLLAKRPEFQDVVTHLDLELDLRAPPHLVGKARLALREGTQGRVRFLLNRDLEPARASDESGRELHWEDEGRLRSDHHKEARVIAVDLAGPVREIVFEYAGEGQSPSSKRDWMGVLRLSKGELRMSMQTCFYPSVPRDLDGPDPLPWPTRLRLLAAPGLEAYAPGRPVACADAPAGSRAWCWESDAPGVLSLFAAARVRRETQLGEARVVTLLREQHAELGEEMARRAEALLRFYTALWGPIGARTLGIVEFETIGASYNWTSDGIIAMEAGALGGGVPVQKLAHEIAHLWWGQEVCARGRGERFLTEGLAEFAAWRFASSEQGAAAGDALAQEARADWWSRVHETGVDPALFDVRFSSRGYSDLAYAKGPLALWMLQRELGEERMDEVLREYRARSAAGGSDSAQLFLEALRARAGAATPDLALIEQQGHAHLELADVALDGTVARGRVQLARCPAGLPAPRLPELVLALHTADEVLRERVRPGASFEVRAPGAIVALALDPDGLLPGERVAPALGHGLGWIASDPADGAQALPLGPFVARLRFGMALREPAEGFVQRVGLDCARAAKAGSTAYFSVRAAHIEDGGHTLALEIAETSPAREHVLVVEGGLETATGIALPTVRMRFTVRDAQGAPRPRIVATEPAQDARGVARGLAQVRIVFSEPMRGARGFPQRLVDDLEDQGWKYPKLGDSRWEDPRTLVWDLGQPLAPGTRYGLPFGDFHSSQLGIGLERFDLRFETAP